MFIKSIVLDGFKSYGNRVEITGFDHEFNAITGLNGTGKSNILDSICFVLGITNLSNVRAGSLQELIYKHGQAGITKATVSITFDNKDKKQCPIGYENHDEITVTRQVVMGGKNKYLINGINVQNKRVSDLFCSVQLNVNNPHFLIMQGRITKVLNMKPPEILSMVEEAAGTRMYEAKKQAAQKTIEKKDAKLRELNDIIREDIAPKLQKLQDERSQFQEYQKVVRELENHTRLYVAWKYVSAEDSTKEAEAKVTEVQDDIKSKKEKIKSNEKEAKELDKQVAELNKKLDEESGSVLKQLESELQALEKTEATSNSSHKAAKDAVSSHEKKARLLDRALAEDEAALKAKKKVLDEVSSTFEGLRSCSEASAAALAEAQQKFLAVSSGLEGASESLQDQLMAAKAEASEAATRISQSMMEKKHAEERLKTLEREFKSSSAQYQRDQDDIGRHQAQVDKLKAELSKMNFSEARNRELKESVRALQSTARSRRDTVDSLAVRLQRCDFNYSAPERDFNHDRVSGTICRLIDVHEPIYCTALETAAGGKLYNVVVDTEVTSKLLLQRGNLQSRTTIIPLNKISAHVMDARTLALAQDVGGGPDKVQLALHLISYPPHVRKAMEWVFGNTLVCADLETAKKVTFHPGVRRRSVTLDGDVFDPSGTLSGGARIKGGSVLVLLQQLKDQEQQLAAAEQQLARDAAELNNMQQAAERYNDMTQKYEMMSHELEVIKARLATTSHAQTHSEIETLRARVAELAATVEKERETQRQTAARAKELEAKVKDIKGHREREFKKAEEVLKKAKKEAEHHSGSWKQREQEFETLRLEVEELQHAVENSRSALQETREAASTLQHTLQDAKEQHAAAEKAVKELQARIKKQKAEIAGRSSDISRLLHQKEQLNKQNGDHELRVKELDYRIKELQGEAQDCQKRIKALEAENPWISSERQYFGAAGGLYDFEARQASVCGQRLAQLRDRKDKLARGLNARAHTLLGKEEEQYQDVMRKKKIVEADRAKLVQVMAELDEKKKKTLVQACEQVNRDFGSIFSMLLPGAQARLKPPDGQSVLDGLEVKVGFNNTWKESLGELSGGQRSLVALSLVLAMLLFKCLGPQVKVGFNNTWKESLGELSGGQRSLVALSLVLAMLLFKCLGPQVKVGFNNTWKESLGELSGGQRSLVALSLVLAMLLFKCLGPQVKVGFNNTWKESLGELSGGQRSLVALSLVLAMLLFKCLGPQVKVGFNNTWKESLGELSGGQRSLVALSLVLAMLLFKCLGPQVKVGFNNTWKESLGELSGGQRSLVALSLVLAMLLFKCLGPQVKVGFNNTWKESLGELSGGQRSLVALSLVLAMLLFKCLGPQVKVGFNNTWKESLGELSGGQRSLVALSLVLAMLLFKCLGPQVKVGFNNTWKESLGELSGGQRSLVALSLVLAMLLFKCLGPQVKVGFNNTWKESLGELSGGQRSLVALSLVLAMLLFKPAPLYILDEVDAALDLSHTQNIGQMLKEHFKASQFIIVSLKDGMFNNANVLFRTKFVDGMSSVQRTVNNRR